MNGCVDVVHVPVHGVSDNTRLDQLHTHVLEWSEKYPSRQDMMCLCCVISNNKHTFPV